MIVARMRRTELGFMAVAVAAMKLKVEDVEGSEEDVGVDNRSEGRKHKRLESQEPVRVPIFLIRKACCDRKESCWADWIRLWTT
jgi:hypothetical protein